MEKLYFLIEYLLEERNENVNIQEIEQEQKERLFRSFCNIRDAKAISEEFLKVQDEYLQEKAIQKGIITDIEDAKIENKIYLWQGDITRLKVDAIVNAANSAGLGCFSPCHNCIDNQIHTFAGVELRLECNKIIQEIKTLETGKAFITKAYNLPSKYVIHTVGPIIKISPTKEQEQELANCYENSLDLARENNIRSIAFPCISTGVFRFPKEQASQIAIQTIKDYLKKYDNDFDKIIFNVFLDEDYEIYKENLR